MSTPIDMKNMPVFGYETHNFRLDDNAYVSRNKARGAAYVPLLGSYIAAKKLKTIWNDRKLRNRVITRQKIHSPGKKTKDIKKGMPSENYNMKALSCRAVIELLGLGILLSPIDLAATTKRKYNHWKKSRKAGHKLNFN